MNFYHESQILEQAVQRCWELPVLWGRDSTLSSRLSWTRPWATWSKNTSFEQAFGLDYILTSFPFIQQFYASNTQICTKILRRYYFDGGLFPHSSQMLDYKIPFHCFNPSAALLLSALFNWSAIFPKLDRS